MPTRNSTENGSHSQRQVVLKLGETVPHEAAVTAIRKKTASEQLATSGTFTATEISLYGRARGLEDVELPIRLFPLKLLKAVEKEYQTSHDLQSAFDALIAFFRLYQESMSMSNIIVAADHDNTYEPLAPADFALKDLKVLRSLGFTTPVFSDGIKGKNEVRIFMKKLSGKVVQAVSNRGTNTTQNKDFLDKIELKDKLYQGIKYTVPRMSKLGLLSYHAWESYFLNFLATDLQTYSYRLRQNQLSQTEVEKLRRSFENALEVLKTKVDIFPGARFGRADTKRSMVYQESSNLLLLDFTTPVSQKPVST